MTRSFKPYPFAPRHYDARCPRSSTDTIPCGGPWQ